MVLKPAQLSPPPAADVEILGEQSGDEFEIEAIEESSSEDDEPLAARTRRPSSGGRRPLVGAAPASGAAAAAAGGAAAAADASGAAAGQRRIDSFMQRVPRGQASMQALAGPPPFEGRQQAGAMAMRPASAEEQQLDMLDYANRMVGAEYSEAWVCLVRLCSTCLASAPPTPCGQEEKQTQALFALCWAHSRQGMCGAGDNPCVHAPRYGPPFRRSLATPPSAAVSATLWRRR